MAPLLPLFEQFCAYCHQSFVPAKRGTQRFCSSSCRTTYSRKKKVGTLGQLTHLPTPVAVRGQGRKSTKQGILEAGAGALGANLITQGVEYLAVLRPMEKKLERMESLVEQMARDHTRAVQVMTSGFLRLMAQAGIPANTAYLALGLPQVAEIEPVAAVRAIKATGLKILG